MKKPVINAAAVIVWTVGIVIVFVLSPADPISLYLAEGAFTIVVAAMWGIANLIGRKRGQDSFSGKRPLDPSCPGKNES